MSFLEGFFGGMLGGIAVVTGALMSVRHALKRSPLAGMMGGKRASS